MKISNNRLLSENSSEVIIQDNTTNKGGTMKPEFIIIHFTAGREATSSVSWFKNPKANASAHLVIGRDGKIYQLIDFNKKAWHAGTSQWANWQGFNNFSIGIELENPGRLQKVGEKYISWFGKEYPKELIVEKIHKHEDIPSFWLSYTEDQLEACMQVSKTLMLKYEISDILGHDDIAPFRKNDPGPMFPMENFRAKLIGRHDDIGDIFKIKNSNVNLRKGPGTNYDIFTQLSKDTEVAFVKSNNGWFYIFVAEKPAKNQDVLYGWVHNSLVIK
jgi:N-acetylmuramoyl-L-alanine amidase